MLHTFSCNVFFDSSDLWQFLRLVSDDDLEEYWSVFCRLSLICDLLDVFLVIRLGHGCFERKMSKVTHWSQRIITWDIYCLHGLSLFMLTSMTWQRTCLLGFFTVKLLFCHLFHAVLFGKKSVGIVNRVVLRFKWGYEALSTESSNYKTLIIKCQITLVVAFPLVLFST